MGRRSVFPRATGEPGTLPITFARVFSLTLLLATLGILALSVGSSVGASSSSTKLASAKRATSNAPVLTNLPPTARSAISAAIGRDQSAYHVRATMAGFHTASPQSGLAAEFVRSGVRVKAGGASVLIAVEGIGRGNALSAVSPVSPQAKANRVEYRRGSLTEWYENGPMGIEQGFRLASPPASAARESRNPLTIGLSLSGALSASLDSGNASLTLKRPDGEPALRYTGLAAYDAAGRELHAWLELEGALTLLRVNDAGARYPIVVDPFVQVAKLTASDGALTDQFGISAAVDGDTVVVGAHYAAIGENAQQGAAYVFVRPAAGWSGTSAFAAKLTSSDGAALDLFANSVAISGNTIVVGAPGASQSKGTAYVFVRPAEGGWAAASGTETVTLTASDGAVNSYFGGSVAIDGGTVVVGAPQASSYVGHAYVFVEPAGGWVQGTSRTETVELVASDGATNGNFGGSIAVSGNTVVVGAYGATINAHMLQGAAYVFVEPEGGWAPETPGATQSQTAKLTASDGVAFSILGSSVAIANNTIFAGAPATNEGAGAVYVFAEPAGGWADTSAFTAKLTTTDSPSANRLGMAVAISSDASTVVAGAIGLNSHQGAAYMFNRPEGGAWASTSTYDQKLTAADGAAGDNFGASAGISGNTIVVGAYTAAIGENIQQGAAYIYQSPASSAAPAITSDNATTFTVSASGSFSVTTTGTPTPSITHTGTLPSGVTFGGNSDGTATLAGTPAAGTGNTYPLVFTASNSVSPDAVQNFTLTVQEAPAITSGSSATFSVGTAGSFMVTATGFPKPTLTYDGSLPSGVSFADNGNGTATLSGTPDAGTANTYSLTITASNGVGTEATQNFTLTVNENHAPAITSEPGTTFVVGTAGSFTVTSTGTPTPTLTRSGRLPRGVNFTDNGNGTATIAGTPAARTDGAYTFTITASNGINPIATQSFTLTVGAALAITSRSSTTFVAGTLNSFTVTSTGSPLPGLTYTGSLPDGVTFVDNGNGTATIAGTPAGPAATYSLTITASNGGSPDVSQSFTLTVKVRGKTK